MKIIQLCLSLRLHSRLVCFHLQVSEQSVVRHLALMDVLSHSMRVPERLGVSPRQHWQREEDGDNVPSLFTMQVPDRLTYTGGWTPHTAVHLWLQPGFKLWFVSFPVSHPQKPPT